MMSCLGLGTAWQRGRGDRAPPRKPPLTLSPGFPRDGIRAGLAPAEGRAPHARKHTIGFPRACLRRPPGVRSPFDAHAIPGLAYGLATRARRPRPSEKTPSASSPTFPRTAIHAVLVPPGGAGSARPQGRHRAKPKIASYWPPAYRKRTGENAMPRLGSGLATRTHGVRPSEKIGFSVIRGFYPLGHPCCASPPGGAGSARP